MATSSITPLSILYDHPSVYRIPRHGEKSPEPREKKKTDVLSEDAQASEVPAFEQARENVKTALEGRKRQNLNALLIPDAEAPEFDRERAEKSKKLAKKAAIIQFIDSLAGVGEMAAFGDEAVVAPVDYSGLGLEALNNLVNLDKQHRIDLRDYNKQKQVTDRENQRIRQGVGEYNAAVDLELAERQQEQALKERQEHYEAALRYISQGKTELAQAHLSAAGLNPDGSGKKKNTGEREAPSNTPSEPESTVTTTPTQAPSQKSPDQQRQEPPQGRVRSSNFAEMSTLENVLGAIEETLGDKPDEGTRNELLNRWKDATREYLTLHEEVNDGEVDWWTENLYSKLLQNLERGEGTREAEPGKEDEEGTGEPKGIFGLFNRMAKLITQPIYSKENVEDLENLLKADPGHGMTWKQLRERRKTNHDVFLKEYLPARMAGDQEKAAKHADTAEKQAIYQAQDTISDSLAGKLDSEVRFELTRRWIDNNNRLLELEQPNLTAQQRAVLSLEMFPEMLKQKQQVKIQDTREKPRGEAPLKEPAGRQRDRRHTTTPEIQDIKNSG